MRVVVYGPPCGGKTTVSAAIADRCGIVRLSCRRMCETEAARATPEGTTWQECERQRLPLPRGLANAIAAKYLHGLESFVVDGYPKTTDEATFFISMTGGPTHLLIVQASLEEVLQRAANRVECRKCVRSFSRTMQHCPSCSGALHPRCEDAPDVVKARFAEYQNKAAEALPVLRGAASEVLEGSSADLLRVAERHAWLG